MKILILVLYVLGICFSSARFMGHNEALVSAILCFLGANILTIRQKKISMV